MTRVGISGTEFLIDGHPTYPGRIFEGKSIQGMLLNVRAVQANDFTAVQNAMRGIEAANQEHLYGVFGDAQWTK